MEYSEDILEILRQRNGLDASDMSKDLSLRNMTHRNALRECCAWELGSPDLASFFIQVATSCGYTVQSNDPD